MTLVMVVITDVMLVARSWISANLVAIVREAVSMLCSPLPCGSGWCDRFRRPRVGSPCWSDRRVGHALRRGHVVPGGGASAGRYKVARSPHCPAPWP